MHALQERFGNLGEEVRAQSVNELMGFQRRGNEPIDSLLVRFDAIRARSAELGGAIISVQGVSWLLLRAIGITDTQLIQLLTPFGGLFPSTEAELSQLKTALRRMGHIMERAPGNLREGLRGPPHAGQTAFLVREHDDGNCWPPDAWHSQDYPQHDYQDAWQQPQPPMAEQPHFMPVAMNMWSMKTLILFSWKKTSQQTQTPVVARSM